MRKSSAEDAQPGQPSTAKTAGEAMVEVRWLLHPDHPLREALLRMNDQGLTFAPVVDGVEVVGVLQVKDLASHERKRPHDRQRLTVRDRMTTTIPFLFEDDLLEVGCAVAAESGATHFCVIDRNQRLTGVVSFEGPNAVDLSCLKEERPSVPLRDARRLANVRPRATESGKLGSYPEGPTLHIEDVR